MVGLVCPSTVRSIKRLVRFSRKPLSSVAPRTESPVHETGNQMRQSDQTELSNKSSRRITAPHRISPPFREKRVDTALNPTVQLVEESAHPRFAVIVPPAPNHRVELVDDFAQLQGSLTAREVSDLRPEPLDRLFPKTPVTVPLALCGGIRSGVASSAPSVTMGTSGRSPCCSICATLFALETSGCVIPSVMRT